MYSLLPGILALSAAVVPVGVTADQISDPAARDTVTVSLQPLVAAAMEHELALRAGRFNVSVAEAGVLSARSVFDPAIQVAGQLDRSNVSAFTPTGPADQTADRRSLSTQLFGGLPVSTQYSVTVSSTYRAENPLLNQVNAREYDNLVTFALTQPLLRGFGSASGSAQLSAAHASLRSSEQQLNRLRAQIIAAVEQRYWILAQREEEEAVSRESLRRAELLLQRNRELRRLGSVNEVDLMTAELGVAARQSTLLRATLLRQNAVDDLLFLVYGQNTTRQVLAEGFVVQTIDAPLPPPVLPPVAVAESLALATRSDLEAERHTLDALETFRGIGANALLPTVNLTASYSALVNNAQGIRLTGARPGDLEIAGWNLRVSAFFPLFNSQARASLSEVQSQTEQQSISVTLVENQVRNEVRAGHRGIELGIRVLAAADSAVRFAQRQYDMESQRLDLGLSDPFRLLQHEDQIAQAQFSEIAARYGLALTVTQYQLALGRDLLIKYAMPLDRGNSP